VQPSDIGQHFGKLLESEKRTDVTFEVDGEIFAAHKVVLAARSPVFMAQFFGPMKDQNSQCIKVEDIMAPVFKVLSLSLSLSLSTFQTSVSCFFFFGSLLHILHTNL
jgi:hypothetical protein